MHDNKVSEKAIWEGSITPDETPITASQALPQTQMMFCYKCNQVIPGNSTFCPYCQVKLFTECPKCGLKYSSQYPACSQCGTNREEYLRAQRQEQERKEAIERENRRQREILERKKLEEERQRKEAEVERERRESLRRYEQQEKERKQKEAYIKENEKIKDTEEYKTTFSLLNEVLERYEKQRKQKRNRAIFLFIIYFLFITFTLANFDLSLVVQNTILEAFIIMSPGLAWGLMIVSLGTIYGSKKMVKFILHHVKKGNVEYDKQMMEYVISKILSEGAVSVDASRYCIEAYRIKNNLPLLSKEYTW